MGAEPGRYVVGEEMGKPRQAQPHPQHQHGVGHGGNAHGL